MFVGFYTFLQDFQSVHGSYVFTANSGMPVQFILENIFRTLGGIFGFYSFDIGVGIQEFPTLHECYGVGAYLCYVFPIVFG